MSYLKLCFKRCAKALPLVLGVTLAVMIVLGLAVAALFGLYGGEDISKTKIGLVGDLEGTYFDLAVYALENLDSSAQYVSFSEHKEDEAKKLLLDGELDGYLFIPEGFVTAIIKREPVPLKYVVRSEPSGLGTALVAEVIDIVAQMVGETQNGIYGMQEYIYKTQEGVDELWDEINEINLRYVSNALERRLWVEVKPVNVAGSPDILSYYSCSVAVVLMMLWGISAFGLLKRCPDEFSRFAASMGLSATKQCFFEYISFFALSLCIFLPLASAVRLLLFGGLELVYLLSVTLALFVITSAVFLVYRAFEKTVSVILFWFTFTLFSCYTAGCFYPSWFFPEKIRLIGLFTPAGVAFEAMKAGSQAAFCPELLYCLAYGALFWLLASLFTKRRVSR